MLAFVGDESTRKAKAEPGLWLQDVPGPGVGINDVLIKVLKTGICGTDLHTYNWDPSAQRTIPVPMVVGHEFVGVVVAVGSNVNGFLPGQIVGAEGHVVCGRCRNCLAGRHHLCKDTVGIGIPSEPMAVDWNTVIFNMLTIKGIYGREMYETWYKMSAMLECGLNIKPVITHRFGADEFEKGFEAMKTGMRGKVILDWTVFH